MALSFVGPYSPAAYNAASIQQAGGAGTPYTKPIIDAGQKILAAQPGVGSGTGTGSADDISFLEDQAAQLRALLGRTDTGLSQGLTQNQDQYDQQVGGATADRAKQVVGQNTAKLGAYNQIDRNAGNGYRSLAQIIGRASGTGSSAFRDLLPNVIGKDTSSKRQAATTTYGTNLSNIDDSFQNVLADLLRQRKTNEESLRSGIETRRQDINGQLATNAGQTATAKGGGYAAVKAAQGPFQAAIDNSRNQVESFFNQLRTPYTPQAISPNLAAYTTDRATINTQNQGGDTSNPYSSLLRKKLTGAA